MWFYWFMFCCDILIPVVMIVGGWMMWKHCPKNINGLMGYRTSRSMRNMDTWNFAHEYCGKLWWKIGWIILILSIIIHIPLYGTKDNTIWNGKWNFSNNSSYHFDSFNISNRKSIKKKFYR